MIGKTYLETGRPVVVLVRWASGEPVLFPGQTRRYGPRNVLIRRESGECVVRSFRGLRKPKKAADA